MSDMPMRAMRDLLTAAQLVNVNGQLLDIRIRKLGAAKLWHYRVSGIWI